MWKSNTIHTDGQAASRERVRRTELRNAGYRRPSNLLGVARHLRWFFDVMAPHGIPQFENIARFVPPEARSARVGVAFVPRLFAQDLSWDDAAWLRQVDSEADP